MLGHPSGTIVKGVGCEAVREVQVRWNTPAPLDVWVLFPAWEGRMKVVVSSDFLRCPADPPPLPTDPDTGRQGSLPMDQDGMGKGVALRAPRTRKMNGYGPSTQNSKLTG